MKKRQTILTGALAFTTALLWVGITALHLMAWQLCLVEESRDQLHVISYLSSFVAIVLAWQLWKKAEIVPLPKAGRIVIQVVQMAGLVGCSYLYPIAKEDLFIQTPPGDLVATQVSYTDKGNPIRLYDRVTKPGELSKFFLATQQHVAQVSRFAMFRDESKAEINCHGWVFTGQHIIKGDDVQTILRDNDYAVTTEPKLKDLVIYSDETGVVVHTGVVCGFLAGEAPLVESKWGITGRYVHLANEQPYSQCYCFYRSPRDGHRLKYCDAPPMDLARDIKAGSSSSALIISAIPQPGVSTWSIAALTDISHH